CFVISYTCAARRAGPPVDVWRRPTSSTGAKHEVAADSDEELLVHLGILNVLIQIRGRGPAVQATIHGHGVTPKGPEGRHGHRRQLHVPVHGEYESTANTKGATTVGLALSARVEIRRIGAVGIGDISVPAILVQDGKPDLPIAANTPTLRSR